MQGMQLHALIYHRASLIEVKQNLMDCDVLEPGIINILMKMLFATCKINNIIINKEVLYI